MKGNEERKDKSRERKIYLLQAMCGFANDKCHWRVCWYRRL